MALRSRQLNFAGKIDVAVRNGVDVEERIEADSGDVLEFLASCLCSLASQKICAAGKWEVGGEGCGCGPCCDSFLSNATNRIFMGHDSGLGVLGVWDTLFGSGDCPKLEVPRAFKRARRGRVTGDVAAHAINATMDGLVGTLHGFGSTQQSKVDEEGVAPCSFPCLACLFSFAIALQAAARKRGEVCT
jgi:hypothetical protein